MILCFFGKIYKKKNYLELLWKLLLRFFGKIYKKKNYLELLWKLWKSQGIEFSFICIYTQHAGSHVLYEKHEWVVNLCNLRRKLARWKNHTNLKFNFNSILSWKTDLEKMVRVSDSGSSWVWKEVQIEIYVSEF